MQQPQHVQERIRAFFMCLGYIVMVTSLTLGLVATILGRTDFIWHLIRPWSWLVYQTFFITNDWYIDISSWTLYNHYLDTPLWIISFVLGALLVLAGWVIDV